MTKKRELPCPAVPVVATLTVIVCYPYVVQAKRLPFYNLHSARLVDMRLGLNWFDDAASRRSQVGSADQLQAQLLKAVDRMDQFVSETGIPLIVVKLAYAPSWSAQAGLLAPALNASSANIPLLDVSDGMSAYGYAPAELRVSVWDSHPNSLAHSLLADVVYAELYARELAP